MMRWGSLITCVLLVGAALGVGFAEDAGQTGEPGSSFFLESIAPESADGRALEILPDPNAYELDLRLSSRIGLRRYFQRSEVEVTEAAFNAGIQELASTSAVLSLNSRTNLEFSRTETTIQDVLSQMVKRSGSTSLSLTQGFGRGSTEGVLGFSRVMETEETPQDGELHTLIQSLDLSTGVGRSAKLQAGATQKESQEAGRLWEQGYHGRLTASLSGGEGSLAYEALEGMVEGHSSDTLRMDLVAPFAIDGATALAEQHVLDTRTDTSSTKERKSNFSLPLNFLRSGAAASYREELKLTNGVRKQKNQLSLATPMTLLGHSTQFEHIVTETIDGANLQNERLLRLTADFREGKGVLERAETVIPSAEGLQRRCRTMLESPKIGLGSALTLAAGHLKEEVVGVETRRTSHFDVTAKPLEPLDIAANYKVYDTGPGAETRDRQVQTVLALSDTTRLRGSISQVDASEGSPAIVRHMELQREKHSDQDLGVRFGYTTYGSQLEDAEPTMLAQLSVGRDTKVSVNALYTEYDEKKLGPLGEATTQVELRAGDPAKIGLRAAYTDQEGRPEPQRCVGLAVRALGGALRLDYVQNPPTHKGNEVVSADLYELAFQRKLFGAVGMDLGYKFSSASDQNDEDHHFKLQLDGGATDRGGQIALSYMSGRFVPYPKNAEPAASLLDLTYKKEWSDSGFITVTVRREEAPELAVDVDDTLEAQLKYQMDF